MVAVTYLCFALFTWTGVVRVDAYLKRYASLISSVHEYYETSSVFFVYSRNNRYLEGYTSSLSLCRDFSRHRVFTLVVNFEELDERTNWYRKRVGRPLVVILLRSMSDVAEFSENTKSMQSMSYPIWLMIFTDDFDRLHCEYCNYPPGNRFRLRFDTEMLVLCCDSAQLREWWAVDDTRTEISDFAIWRKDAGLTILVQDGLYARRHDVKGAGLRVGIVTTSPLVREEGDEMGGFFGEVVTELIDAMNFTVAETIRDPGFGTWHAKAKAWTGLVGKLTRGEVDLGVADFTITSARLDVIDYTLPLWITRGRLYMKAPDVPDGSVVQWSAYFQAFSMNIWIAIILLILTAPIMLTAIKVHGGSMSLLSLLVENYLYVWGIFCQQGLCEFPITTSLRIAYFSIFVSALVISAAYSASLVSFLAISSSSLPFTNLEGFARDGSYKVIVFKTHSEYDLLATSSDPVLKKMMALMKPRADLPETLENGWDQVCREKVALFTNDLAQITSYKDINCKVASIDTGSTDSIAMIMPAYNQFTKVINYHIQRFQDTGMVLRLKNKYFPRSTVAETKFDVVHLGGVAPILATLAGGIVLAFVVLFCEKTYYSLGYSRRVAVKNLDWPNVQRITATGIFRPAIVEQCKRKSDNRHTNTSFTKMTI